MPNSKIQSASKLPRPLKRAGSVRDLVISVMARIRDDEQKLIQHMRKLVKEHKSYAVQILTTEIGGWMPLHACVLRGSKKMLKFFLTSGVNINTEMGQPDGLPNKCSPLHMACIRGDADIIDLLLAKGANIEAMDSFLVTPVIYAANRKHRQAVRLLQKRGANMAAVHGSLTWEECVTPQPNSHKFCFF